MYNYYVRCTSGDSAIYTSGTDHLLWGGAWYQVYPGVGRDIEKIWQKDGHRYREILNGDLWFVNHEGHDDYTLFSTIISPSAEIEIRIEQILTTTTSDWWSGYFSIIDGAWDSDRGVFKVGPTPNDAYRYFTELGDKEYNIYNLSPSVSVSANIDSNTDTVYSECTALSWVEWQDAYAPNGDPTPGGLSDLWALYAYVASVNCGGSNFIHEYRRQWIDFDPDDLAWTYEGVAQYGNNYGVWSENEAATQTVTLAFGNSRWIRVADIIDYLVNAIAGAAYKSTFFENDTVVGGGSGGTDNYVTSVDPNPLKNLLITQKSNTKPTSDPALKWPLSFNDLMDILKNTFNVDWFIDADGNFRIEHYSYFSKTVDIDLTVDHPTYIYHKNKWTYDTEKMPNREHFEFMESKGVDFVGMDIVYDSLATGNRFKDNQKDYKVNGTTDVPYMINFPDDITDEGWAIVTNDGTYIRNATGVLSGIPRVNADLSWANLHNDYWKHGRVIEVGLMNSIVTPTTFTSWQRNIKQVEITFPASDLDPLFLKTTELGDGEVGEAKYRLLDGTVTTVFFYLDVNVPSPPPEESFLIKTSGIWLLLKDIDFVEWKS